MEKHAIGILGIIAAVAIIGLVSLQEPETTGMAARKIIVHHGQSLNEINNEAGIQLTEAQLNQYGIKIIDENRIATPGRGPVGIIVQVPDRQQSRGIIEPDY